MLNKIEEILNQESIKRDIINDVVLYKGEAFSFFDAGLTRYVFTNEDKTKVIKFLIEDRMFDYNELECEIYDNAREEDKKQMAKTTLELNGMVIEQEFCNPIKFDDRKLNMSQIRFARSCRNEVGWNSEGNLVCFDLDEFKKY